MIVKWHPLKTSICVIVCVCVHIHANIFFHLKWDAVWALKIEHDTSGMGILGSWTEQRYYMSNMYCYGISLEICISGLTWVIEVENGLSPVLFVKVKSYTGFYLSTGCMYYLGQIWDSDIYHGNK